MSKGNCAAVRVKLFVHINPQIFSNCYRLCCKSFVSFDDIEIFNLQSCLFHYFLCSSYRADTHHFRPYACKCACYISSHRLNAQFFCFFFAHNNNCSSAVIDAGSIACSNETALVNRAKFSKPFYAGARTRTFIHFELYHFFFLLYHYRYDFFIKCAGFLCSFRLLLALQCELVQFFPCKAPFFANIVCCLNHMILVKCIPKSIVYHSIY